MSVRIRVETIPPDEPYYAISVAAGLVNLHPQTLRHYETLGLVVPQRSRGNIRLYRMSCAPPLPKEKESRTC